MAEELMVVNNKDQSRFQVEFDNGETAFIEYKMLPGKITFIHTEVPKDMGGRGIAGQLAKFALDYARAGHLRINIYCSYIAAYVKKNHDYDDLIDHTLS
jgi:predicted GNAT family acetyltransferase